MEAIASLIEIVLEIFGRKVERGNRPELPGRVPSIRFRRGSDWDQPLPVDMVVVAGERYLLWPDVADLRWSRSLREKLEARLVLSDGLHRITVRELDDRDKVPILREYGRRGYGETRRWHRLNSADLRKIGRNVPVFQITSIERGDT